jgi:hypothetical protein
VTRFRELAGALHPGTARSGPDLRSGADLAGQGLTLPVRRAD